MPHPLLEDEEEYFKDKLDLDKCDGEKDGKKCDGQMSKLESVDTEIRLQNETLLLAVQYCTRCNRVRFLRDLYSEKFRADRAKDSQQ